MTLAQALILGTVQGVTEFLPVSSSGHLVIFQNFFKLEPPLFFDVVVHVGTLTSVLVYFYRDLLKISLNQIKLLIIGTIPAIAAGLVIKPYLEAIFSSLIIVAIGLLLTSLFLITTYFTKSLKLNLEKLSLPKAFIIGLFQAMAIIPGVSRSGSTVAAALNQGLNKKDAFYFSFLLAIPAILGALVLQASDISSINTPTPQLVIGFVSAAISGFASLKLLSLMINKSRLHYFAAYTLPLALVLLLLS